MNRDETIKLLTLVKLSYPMWSKDLKDTDARAMVMLWGDMLGEYEFDIVQAALKSLLATNKWPPSIAEIIEKAQFINSGGRQELSEIEAWSMVRKALGNGTYGAREEFERLPSEIQAVLREPATIKNWAQLEPTEIDTVVASNFMRSFKEVRKREKEYKALPGDVRTLIANTTNKLIGEPR